MDYDTTILTNVNSDDIVAWADDFFTRNSVSRISAHSYKCIHELLTGRF